MAPCLRRLRWIFPDFRAIRGVYGGRCGDETKCGDCSCDHLFLQLGQADVDVLSAAGLVAVDGQEMFFAGLQGRRGGGEDFDGFVVAVIAAELRRPARR